MQYHLEGVPDDLPPGQYNTRLVGARFVTCRDGSVELLLHAEFAGPLSPNRAENGLLIATKHAEGQQVAERVHEASPEIGR